MAKSASRPALRDTVTYREAIGHSRAFVEVRRYTAALGRNGGGGVPSNAGRCDRSYD